MTEDALNPEELEAILADADGGSDEEDGLSNFESSMDFSSESNKSSKKSKSVKEEEDEEEEDEKGVTKQQEKNIQLLLDIYMNITVELGKSTHKVKDILGWGEGSIIELEKPATEPVSLLVNKRLVARGEVVVIDENFGVRITEIVSPRERLESLT